MKKLLFLMSVVALWGGSLLAPVAVAQVSPAHVIARGAPIHGANGMMFDGKDRLHVASVGMRSIVVIDPETGAILDRIGPDRGVEGPDDLTFGPDGSLYWTAILTGEVGKLSPDGVKSTVAKLPPGVNPITFSDDGRLFVALDFLGDGLYELDPTGAQPPRLLIDKLGWLNAMDFGPDGLLYGPIFTQGRVVKIDVNAQPATVTTVADGFGVPVAVKFDTQGRLHVLDQAKGQVVRIDTATGAKEVIATIAPGLDNLAFDSRGRLFVSSNDDGFIVEVRPDGTPRTVTPGGMIAPGGVALLPRADGSEAVIVGDMFTLREFNGQTGVPGDVAHHPANTIARDGDRLVLSSWFANAVQVWDPAQRTVVENYADFKVPLNAIRFQGDLIVAELGTASIVRQRGANPSERTTLAAGLGVPAGLAATADSLWATDWAAGTVLQLVAGGQPLQPPKLVAQGLAAPEGLAVDRDGSLLVVESGAGRLSRIDSATGKASVVADGLAFEPPMPGAPPPTIFNGVAVGPSGAIYVSGAGESVLYRIDRPAGQPAALPRTGGDVSGINSLLTVLGGLAILGGLGAALLRRRSRQRG